MRRDAIRQTYASEAGGVNAVVVFHIGTSLKTTENIMLQAEADQWNDIVQHSIIDHPFNSTLKTLSILSWFKAEF